MRCPQTPPLRRSHGAGNALAMVKVEDGWVQSPPAPASCQLSRQGHSPYFTGDTREVRVPRWGPMTLGKFWVPKPTGKNLLLFWSVSLSPASTPKLFLVCSESRPMLRHPLVSEPFYSEVLTVEDDHNTQVASPPFSSELGTAENTFKVPHWRISCLADPWSLL